MNIEHKTDHPVIAACQGVVKAIDKLLQEQVYCFNMPPREKDLANYTEYDVWGDKKPKLSPKHIALWERLRRQAYAIECRIKNIDKALAENNGEEINKEGATYNTWDEIDGEGWLQVEEKDLYDQCLKWAKENDDKVKRAPMYAEWRIFKELRHVYLMLESCGELATLAFRFNDYGRGWKESQK